MKIKESGIVLIAKALNIYKNNKKKILKLLITISFKINEM